jgi:hypothetical protein
VSFYNGIEYIGSDDMYSIETVVKKVNKIRYGLLSKKQLDDITTEEFRKSIEPCFYKKPPFYSVNGGFMETYKESGDNEAKVTVTIDDTKGRIYQHITFDILPDGKYLISKIEYDI